MRPIVVLLIILIVVFLTCCGNTTKQEEVKVEHIYDGDTFKLTNGKIIRLYEIDCPESKQEYGDKATKYTDSVLKASTKVLILKFYDDDYGREISKVFVDGQCLSKLLVTNGLAWVYKRYASVDMYNSYLYAKITRVGLWSQPNPIPPFLFRKQLDL
jgi:micrococcal nuclease